MAKDAFWFRHDSNARNDPKVIKLRRKSGLDGVGLFWCTVEILRESETYTLPMENIEDICYDLRCDENDFNLLFEVGLLQKNKNIFWSESLNERMSEWEDIREKKSKAGKKSGEARRKKRENKIKKQTENEHCSNTVQTEGEQSANKNEPFDRVNVLDRVNIPNRPKRIKVKPSVKALELSHHLFDKMLENNPSAKKPNFDSWGKHVDLMFTRDNRTEEQIRYLIGFSQKDHFWSQNILSTSKLRKQFDALAIKVKQDNKPKTTSDKSDDVLANWGRKIAQQKRDKENGRNNPTNIATIKTRV